MAVMRVPGATISALCPRAQAAIYRRSTPLDLGSTRGREGAGMSARDRVARSTLRLAPLGVVAETVDRGFDWGSAAVGAGTGAAATLLIVAVATVARSRGVGAQQRGGRRPSRR